MPAAPQAPRWFVDENSLGVAKALAYVRGDLTWPGAPGGPVPTGAADTAWLPIVGQAGLVVLTRDKRIRSRPLERQALLNHGVRACFVSYFGRPEPRPVLPAPAVAAVLGRHRSPRRRAAGTLARQRHPQRCPGLRHPWHRPTTALTP